MLKITIISKSYEKLEKENYNDIYMILINGKCLFKVQDGEPEDNHMGTNFKDVYNIPELIKAILDVTSKGESYEIVYLDFEDGVDYEELLSATVAV